mmetsp:Transcript_102896/g.320623  ORF Transcript_102896/g.320623 Transcript_102896/m.320623 type:complete len:1217 (+) Transcript_102896:71-3721(+)
MADEGAFAATQAYPATMPEAAPEAAPEEPQKKKRGKPKDDMAPPKPKNAYQKVTGEARTKIKAERPELATDLKAMGIALKEAWDATPEDVKERMTKEYEEEMAIWKPKWAAYKLTPHYKEFFEIKQDWVDARQRKKLVKKYAKEAPKRPKSAYMLFAGEIRERVQKEVMEAGGGMGDIGKKISEEWAAVPEARKEELAKQSAEMKKKFDVDYAEYKQTEAFADFCEQKAKMESKQLQKKLVRTKLDEAPKKAQSAYALFRSEVMPKVTEEHKGLGAGELGKKIAEMWVAVPAAKKEEYQAQSAKLKEQYEENFLAFKKAQKYMEYLREREQVKAKENKLLGLRTLPKRPPSAFSMYATEHKSEVEPGKGEGKGRDALMKKYAVETEEEKAKYLEKEKELKIKWMEDTQAFKESKKFLDFKATEKKIKMEFMTEASKVLTLKFFAQAPKQPPKSPFAVFVGDKRKAAGESESLPKDKKARIEELARLKEEWAKADLQTRYNCEVQKKERQAKWKEDCKEYMANDTWKEYLAECKKLKVPVQSLLKEKKKILRKLKNGMAILPLPSKPESFPVRPQTAIKKFGRDKLGEIKDKSEIPALWTQLDEETKRKYQAEADEKFAAYRAELKEFQASEEGKTYLRQLKSVGRRNRLAKAKDTYLTDLPKKPASALKNFMLKNAKAMRIQHPGVKGPEFKKLMMDKWENMDESQKTPILEEEKAKMDAYSSSLEDFKKSENWIKFKRVIKVKAKAKAKKKSGGPNIPKPKRPEALPQKPLDAFKSYCKEMAGAGKALGDLAKMFKELSADEREERQNAFKEKMLEYQQQTEEFDKTPEGRKYAHAIASYLKKKRLLIAKQRFMKDEPKRSPSAFTLFAGAKRADVQRENPDLKGLGPVQTKLSDMWRGLSDEERAEWTEKETKAKEEFEEKMEEFQKTPNYKKYQAIVSRLTKKPGAKKVSAKKKGIALPPPPTNLPKKPPTGFFLFMSEKRSAGGSGGLGEMTKAWRELGAEGQKKYQDEAAEKLAQYEKDMKEFTKSVDGKKYLRLKGAAEKKDRQLKAKAKFLGGEEAPKEPKRPPSAYFLFVQETRSKLPPGGKISEVAKQLTEMWQKLTAEEKKVYEEKAEELKKQYDKDMAAYKNTASFKKYDKAIKNINKKKHGAKPKKKALVKGRGAGGGKGRGGGAGRGRGRGASPAKAAASDSDSDVMGNDEDNSSSSSDSDSD